jgi:hypothetical protein
MHLNRGSGLSGVFAVSAWVLLSGGAPSASAAETAFPKPRIESIEGAKTALLQDGLSLREVSAGEEVRIGERIRTDGKTRVTVSYADGSQLVVYPNSDLEIEKPDKDGVQSNQLRGGDVKGVVQKAPSSKTTASAPAQPKAKVKFIIRTKTAVMGVRGTEFVAGFNAISNIAEFHTLEGVVEVAANPAQLASGSGVQVAGGQFVQATETGISALKAFDPSSFMGSLGTSTGSIATSAASNLASNAASAGLSSAAPDLSSSPQQAAAPAPPPKLPPPPPPPPVPPAEAEKKAAAAAKEKARMHIVAFSVAGFMSENPNPATHVEKRYYRALQVHWTPMVPVPMLNFLYVRGSFGATLFEHYSLNNAFLVHDYQLLAGTTLLSPLFFEFGGGHQAWRNDRISGGIVGGNIGLLLNPNGRLNRAFIGVSRFLRGTQPHEIHAGIGILLF